MDADFNVDDVVDRIFQAVDADGDGRDTGQQKMCVRVCVCEVCKYYLTPKLTRT